MRINFLSTSVLVATLLFAQLTTNLNAQNAQDIVWDNQNIVPLQIFQIPTRQNGFAFDDGYNRQIYLPTNLPIRGNSDFAAKPGAYRLTAASVPPSPALLALEKALRTNSGITIRLVSLASQTALTSPGALVSFSNSQVMPIENTTFFSLGHDNQAWSLARPVNQSPFNPALTSKILWNRPWDPVWYAPRFADDYAVQIVYVRISPTGIAKIDKFLPWNDLSTSFVSWEAAIQEGVLPMGRLGVAPDPTSNPPGWQAIAFTALGLGPIDGQVSNDLIASIRFANSETSDQSMLRDVGKLIPALNATLSKPNLVPCNDGVWLNWNITPPAGFASWPPPVGISLPNTTPCGDFNFYQSAVAAPTQGVSRTVHFGPPQGRSDYASKGDWSQRFTPSGISNLRIKPSNGAVGFSWENGDPSVEGWNYLITPSIGSAVGGITYAPCPNCPNSLVVSIPADLSASYTFKVAPFNSMGVGDSASLTFSPPPAPPGGWRLCGYGYSEVYPDTCVSAVGGDYIYGVSGSFTVPKFVLPNSPIQCSGAFFGVPPVANAACFFISAVTSAGPSAPSLVVPTAGATAVPPNITISWTQSASTPPATSWNVCLGLTSPAPCSITVSSTSFSPSSPLISGREYFLRVGAISTSGTTFSPEIRFTVSGAEPTARIISPVQGQSNVPVAAMLQWEGPTGQYRVSMGLSEPLSIVATVPGFNYQPAQPLTPATRYCAQVTPTTTGAVASPVVCFTTLTNAGNSSSVSVITSSLSPATLGDRYSAGLTAGGGSGGYSWAIASGELPPGLSLTSFGGLLSGLIGGTPTNAGLYSFTIRVTDGSGATAIKPMSITVSDNLRLTSNAIHSAASELPQAVSPGELIVLYPTGLRRPSLSYLQIDSSGRLLTTLSDVQVLFDQTPAPLIYVAQTGQISAIAPYSLAGKTSTNIQVVAGSSRSNVVSLPVSRTSPALFTYNSSGTGGAAALNEDNTINTPGNAASRNSTIVLFGTGEGQTSPSGVDGTVTGFPAPVPVETCSASIGGVSAPVVYFGGVSGLVSGVFQANVVIPQGVTAGPAVPVAVTCGGVQSQAAVTIAVKL